MGEGKAVSIADFPTHTATRLCDGGFLTENDYVFFFTEDVRQTEGAQASKVAGNAHYKEGRFKEAAWVRGGLFAS